MAERRSSATSENSASSASGEFSQRTTGDNISDCSPSPPPRKSLTLLQPSKKKKGDKGAKALRVLFSVFRTLPVFGPKCTLSPLPVCLPEACKSLSSSSRITGTLFGSRKGRVTLSLQENPMCMPSRIIELAIQTHVLLREMSSGMVRIALECEKKHDRKREAIGKLLDESTWNMFCNGKKTGYGIKREATEEDIRTMEHLRAVSMGAGVLPVCSERGSADGDGEIAYLRSSFDHVVGSRDSETLYMISPHGNAGPDLTLFFVRI